MAILSGGYTSPAYGGVGGESNNVIYFETNFASRAETLRRAAKRVTQITTEEIDAAGEALGEIGKQVLQDYTPVDTGALRDSTEAAFITGGRSGRQFEVVFQQPATNEQGTEYAPFVIRGHATRNPDIRVPPNPYPQVAMQAMEPEVNAILARAGRRIAQRTVRYMGGKGE